MSETVVYWLFDENCTDVQQHGYVGISARFANRLKDHRCNKALPPFQYVILFRGTEDECFELEKRLRPHHGIGWNKTKGGPNQGRTLGYEHSEETGAKISAALRGRGITWGDKIAKALTGHIRSEASKNKQSRAVKGKPKSVAQRAAMSAAAKDRYSDPVERKLASQYQIGKHDHRGEKNPRFGIVMSDEVKANISAGRKGKALGNQNWKKRKPYSSEALQKMSEASKRRWRDHPRP